MILTGGETTATISEISVRNDSVLILIVAATSFKRFDDVTGDPGSNHEIATCRSGRKTPDD